MELRYGFFLTVLVCGFCNCQMEDIQEMFSKNKYCGASLSNILSTICGGNYNTLYRYPHKKSYWPANYQDVTQSDDAMVNKEPQLAEQSSKISREKANSIFSRTSRRKRGVYNECCEKSCTTEELSMYCGLTKRKRRDIPIQ